MEYISIRTSTLRGDQKINFDAFLKINNKMLLYLRRGDSFEGERLKRLIDRKVRKMFIAAEEEPKYRTYLQSNINSAYDNNSGKDIASRAEIVQGVQTGNVEEVFEDPGNAVIYREAKDSAEKYVHFLLTNDNAVNSVLKIDNADKNLAHHGVSVATLSVALAKKLNIEDPKKTQLLALGAFLHDFGHQEATYDLSKSKSTMTREEYAIYIAHAQHGARKVQDKKHFDQTVINIIAQHEEINDGSGPCGLKESQQDPLATIVSVANQMDRMITFEGIPRAEAPKKMMLERMGMHNLQHMKFLAEIIKAIPA